MIRRFLFTLFISLSLTAILPAPVFAVSESACVSDITCYCSGKGTDGGTIGLISLASKAVETIDECRGGCRELTDPAELAGSTYKFQCKDTDGKIIEPSGGSGCVDVSCTPGAIAEASLDTTDNSERNWNLIPKRDPVIPILNVPIPGLSFENALMVDPETGTVKSNLLGIYVRAVYRYLIGVAALIAVVMLMVGGLEYLISAGSAKRVDRARGRMRNAVSGLILLLLAYNLAFLIDPNTVSFSSLSIQGVDGIPFELQASEDAGMLDAGNRPSGGPGSGNLVTITGRYIIPPSPSAGNLIDPVVLLELQKVSEVFYKETGKKIRVTSASRTVATQAEMFYRHCIATGGKCDNIATCEPTGAGSWSNTSTVTFTKGSKRPWSMTDASLNDNKAAAVAKLIENGEARNCPHTSNVAIDAWPEGTGSYTANVDQMAALIRLMTSNEDPFCRLNSEAWHFELDRISMQHGNCKRSNNTTTVKGNTPPANCLIYNFRNFTCTTPRPN